MATTRVQSKKHPTKPNVYQEHVPDVMETTDYHAHELPDFLEGYASMTHRNRLLGGEPIGRPHAEVADDFFDYWKDPL